MNSLDQKIFWMPFSVDLFSKTDEEQWWNNEFEKKKKNGNKFAPVIIVIFIHQLKSITNVIIYQLK